LVADVLFSQSVDCSRRDIPEYGTPHPDSVRWPHHKFVYFSPLEGAAGNGRDEMYEFFYVADRENQDLYNFEHSQADIGGTKFDTINRSYVFVVSTTRTIRRKAAPDRTPTMCWRFASSPASTCGNSTACTSPRFGPTSRR
jgi:hypothetical protein